MRYRVRNCKSKRLKRVIGTALEFYAKKLMHNNLHRNLFVEVRLDKMRSDEYAECYPTNTDNKKPRKFVIRIKDDAKKPLLALSHEMIHVKQYAKQELCLYHSKWKNTIVRESTPYSELPWEKQAYKLDYFLYKDFKESFKTAFSGYK